MQGHTEDRHDRIFLLRLITVSVNRSNPAVSKSITLHCQKFTEYAFPITYLSLISSQHSSEQITDVLSYITVA